MPIVSMNDDDEADSVGLAIDELKGWDMVDRSRRVVVVDGMVMVVVLRIACEVLRLFEVEHMCYY